MSQGYRRRAKKKVDQAELLRETEGRSGEGLFQMESVLEGGSGQQPQRLLAGQVGQGLETLCYQQTLTNYWACPDAVLGQST